MRTVLLTVAAMTAFASNSLLCRMALGQETIDAASFSTVRVITGGVCLTALVRASRRSRMSGGSWSSAFILFLYAVPFSYAFGLLTTGTGSLIMFGTVQVTMMGAGLLGGERPHPVQWLGLAAAVAGLVYLMAPGFAAPAPLGALLMVIAGVAWGVYSLRGRPAGDPLAENAGSFWRAIPLTTAVSLAGAGQLHVTWLGFLLAAASGAVASGLGYVAWYGALPHLSATRASLVQLVVPILAALGGLVVLGEPVSARLVASAVLVLGGVALALGVSERHSSTPIPSSGDTIQP